MAVFSVHLRLSLPAQRSWRSTPSTASLYLANTTARRGFMVRVSVPPSTLKGSDSTAKACRVVGGCDWMICEVVGRYAPLQRGIPLGSSEIIGGHVHVRTQRRAAAGMDTLARQLDSQPNNLTRTRSCTGRCASVRASSACTGKAKATTELVPMHSWDWPACSAHY